MAEPTHAIVLEGAPSYLTEVQRALEHHGIASEIVKPPDPNANT